MNQTAYEIDRNGLWSGRSMQIGPFDARPSNWIISATPPPVAGEGQSVAWPGSVWTVITTPAPSPPPAALARVPASISDRQFFQQLALMAVITETEALNAVRTGTIPATLKSVIDTLPGAQKFAAEMSVSGAVEFRRAHPMTTLLAAGMGWSSAQVDALWIAASQL